MVSELMLNQIDWLTLSAFLQTIGDLETPLPKETISQINEIGRALSNGDRDAIDHIEEIADQQPLIKTKYETICEQLQEQLQAKYKPQELPIPRQRETADAELQSILENVVLPSLTDPDPKAAAKTRKQKIKEIFMKIFKNDN